MKPAPPITRMLVFSRSRMRLRRVADRRDASRGVGARGVIYSPHYDRVRRGGPRVPGGRMSLRERLGGYVLRPPLNPARYHLSRWLEEAARRTPVSALVLDAG